MAFFSHVDENRIENKFSSIDSFPISILTCILIRIQKKSRKEWKVRKIESISIHAKLSAFRLMVLMFSIFNTLVLESHPTQNKQNAKIYNFWWKSFFCPFKIILLFWIWYLIFLGAVYKQGQIGIKSMKCI